MNKILLTLITLAASVHAQEIIKVAGDRVSLRAAPEVTAVLLDRAMLGDELVLKDNSNPDWVGVLPPSTVDLWVSGEFVSNNIVLPDILNIRSGPSLSHSVVGTAQKGDLLTVRGEVAEWLRIAPVSNTVVWISRNYVDAPLPVVIEPAAAPVSELVTQAVVQVVAEPTVQEVLSAISAAADTQLVQDPNKEQGVSGTYFGVLQPADGTLYKLTDDHFTDITVCHVRGNRAQMQTFTGMKLEITGKTYWASGLDLPVVVPARIRLIPAK